MKRDSAYCHGNADFPNLWKQASLYTRGLRDINCKLLNTMTGDRKVKCCRKGKESGKRNTQVLNDF